MRYYDIIDLKNYGVKWEFKETNEDITNINISKPITINDINLDNINNIDLLITKIKNFNHPIKKFSNITILPKLHKSDLLVITDIPSLKDCENNEILSSEDGELLKKMLNAININIEETAITPLIFWRTPGGQIPNTEDLKLTKPFIKKIIELINPKAILAFGNIVSSELLNTNLISNHGEILKIDSISTIPIYHPNDLILNPSKKRDVWTALQKLQKILQK